jgi:hypothetical protein
MDRTPLAPRFRAVSAAMVVLCMPACGSPVEKAGLDGMKQRLSEWSPLGALDRRRPERTLALVAEQPDSDTFFNASQEFSLSIARRVHV